MAPDNKIGRFISEAVGSLPKLSPSVFDKLVNDSLQVRLCFVLVVYWEFLFLMKIVKHDGTDFTSYITGFFGKSFQLAFHSLIVLTRVFHPFQDHLLLLYLSSITRTQLSLAEKLNTAAQILWFFRLFIAEDKFFWEFPFLSYFKKRGMSLFYTSLLLCLFFCVLCWFA